MIKQHIPSDFKIRAHVLKNGIKELLNGHTFNMATSKPDIQLKHTIYSCTQELRSNPKKKINLQRASELIRPIVIMPREIFSFWRVVGRPTAARGFVESRSLVGGSTVPTIGGGLCQLSGLIYLAALHTDLKIIERHNHSVDIYTDETRYMPLGGDATVAYAYKDLKIRNTLSAPISIDCNFNGDQITLKLMHDDELTLKKVSFNRISENNDSVKVGTTIDGSTVGISTYRKP